MLPQAAVEDAKSALLKSQQASENTLKAAVDEAKSTQVKALKDSEATQKTLKAAADEAKSSLAKALKDSEAAQKQLAARLKQAEARIKELEVQLQAGTVRGGGGCRGAR